MPLQVPAMVACALVLLLPALVTASVPEFGIHLTTSPSTVTEHLTKALTVNCSIVLANSTIIQPLSLTIKKSNIRNPNNYTDVAVVTSLSTNIKGLFAVNSTSNSHLAPDGKDSYIAVHWTYPEFSFTGSYMCELKGFDEKFHIVAVENKTDVKDSKPDIIGALGAIQDHEQRISQLEGVLVSQGAALTAFASTLFIATSPALGGSKYMVSRPVMRNSAVAESICKLYGGYLAEFDLQEFITIKRFLDNATNSGADKADTLANGTVLVGVTDEFVEDEWRFRAHPAELFSASFTDWVPGAGHRGKSENCAVLTGSAGWKLNDVPCYDNKELVHFLCEVENKSP